MRHPELSMKKQLLQWLRKDFFAANIETEETQKGYPDVCAHLRPLQGELAAVMYVECKSRRDLPLSRICSNRIDFKEGQYPYLWKLYMSGAAVFVAMETQDSGTVFIPMWAIDYPSIRPSSFLQFDTSTDLRQYLTTIYTLRRMEHIATLNTGGLRAEDYQRNQVTGT